MVCIAPPNVDGGRNTEHHQSVAWCPQSDCNKNVSVGGERYLSTAAVLGMLAPVPHSWCGDRKQNNIILKSLHTLC